MQARILDSIDFVASEARYHRNCRLKFETTRKMLTDESKGDYSDSSNHKSSVEPAKIFTPQSVIPSQVHFEGVKHSVMFVPNDNETYDLMKILVSKLQPLSNINVEKIEFFGFKTVSNLETYINLLKAERKVDRAKPLFAYIGKSNSSEKLSYGFWLISDYIYNTNERLFKPYVDFQYEYYSNEMRSLNIYQSILNQLYIERSASHENKAVINNEIYIQQFPAPPINTQSMTAKLYTFVSTLLIGFAFLFFVSSFIVRILSEKGTRMTEFLKLTGMTTGMYWGSWFINGFFFMGAQCFLLVALMSGSASGYTSIISNSNKGLIIIFFLMYAASTVFFCFALSVFFTKAVFAVLMALVIWTASILFPAMGISGLFGPVTPISPALKSLLCILPNFSLYFGLNAIFNFEVVGSAGFVAGVIEGLKYNRAVRFHKLLNEALLRLAWKEFRAVLDQQSDYNKGQIEVMNEKIMELYSGLQVDNFYDVLGDADLSLGSVEIMMFISWILNIFIMWYFGAVWPWQIGFPRPFYFPFTKSYWFGIKGTEFDDFDAPTNTGKYFEMNGSNQQAGIDFRKLTKIFSQCSKSEKVAVDNISLKLFKGQITALLGHNGSGKTTTISMITGMFPPTTGSIAVNGFNIAKNLNEARRTMGFCPQDSIYFNELTVEEHLELIGILKETDTNDLQENIERVCQAVDLKDKMKSLATTLSGGMKRKLSLAMAMIGDSDVLLLDEPTSGLDPEARRKVWDMLLSIRLDKTIVLTTHYMEEADALGDRIAILTHGKIFCCGSTMFLKEKFGAGYHLRMVKNQNCDVDKLRDMISTYFDTKLERSSGQEVSFQIEASNVSSFPSLFSDLEKNKVELGIESFGLSVTNMEDVFLKVGNIVDSEMDAEKDVKANKDLTKTAAASKSYMHVTGMNLVLLQLYGLFLKRFHYNRRQMSSLIIMVIVPVLLICGAIGLNNFIDSFSSTSSPLTEYSLSNYGETSIFYESDSDDISSTFETIIQDLGSKPKSVSNVSEALINIGEKSLYDYQYNHIVAANFSSSSKRFTALYNSAANFAPIICVNLMYNTILKAIIPSSSIDISIGFYELQDAGYEDRSILVGFIFGCIYPLAFIFITAFCVKFIIVERTSKSKHLQLMTKLNKATFWLGHYIYDFCICLICFIPIIIIFAADTGGYARSSMTMGDMENRAQDEIEKLMKTFRMGETCGSIFAIILFIMAALPLHYLVSFIINRPAVAFALLTVLELISTIVMVIFVVVEKTFHYFPDFMRTGVKNADKVFRFFPTYTITKILTVIKMETTKLYFCDSYIDSCSKIDNSTETYKKCCVEFTEFDPLIMDEDHCGMDYLILFISMLIYFALLCFVESPFSDFVKTLIERFKERISKSKRIVGTSDDNGSDIDVQNNTIKIDEIVSNEMYNDTENHALLVHNLTKKFPKIVAVDGITFGVEKQQCFGLLGVNGAGKTTSFSMLTGDLSITSGNAHIGNIDVKSKKSQVSQDILKLLFATEFLLDRNTHIKILRPSVILFTFKMLTWNC
ncbi:ATP-binding cassette sub-family A member 3 [Nymphon striatum]|nr:ATP-binding cassette sub-family A member 3 [Nymphon striatum]